MAERFKFNDEKENIDENDNQQDDLEKEYYDNTDYSYTKNKKRPKTKKVTRKKTKTKVKKKKNGRSKISTFLITLLILLLIAGAGVGGYFAYEHYQDQQKQINQLEKQVDQQNKRKAGKSHAESLGLCILSRRVNGVVIGIGVLCFNIMKLLALKRLCQ